MHIYTLKEIFKDNELIVLTKKKMADGSIVHTHEFIEIIYTFSGSATHIINGNNYQAERGSMFFIPQGYTHDIKDSISDSYSEILVRADVVDVLFSQIKNEADLSEDTFYDEYVPYIHTSFSGEKRRKVEAIIQDMLTEYNSKEFNSQNVLLGYLNILITLAIRNRITVPQKLKGIPIDVINYIDIHYRKHFKIEELASKSFYSPKYFSHIFKQTMGMCLSDYIAKRRVDEGARLLIETDMTVDEISKNLGWENNTQFYNNFKKHYGVTPHSYRKKNR